MLTVFRILFGKNAKIGDELAHKGSSLSFFMLYNHIKNSYRSIASMTKYK
ncbi:hypothetical protein ACFFHH_00655 [Cytobacillus solani]|nr:hypothetical protein [Cytobacillus solani]